MAFSIDFQQPVFLNVPWDRITALKNYGTTWISSFCLSDQVFAQVVRAMESYFDKCEPGCYIIMGLYNP